MQRYQQFHFENGSIFRYWFQNQVLKSSECKCKNALTVDTPQQEFQRVSQVAVSEESSFSSTHLARHIGRGGSRCPVYTQTQGRGDTGTQGHGALWWEVPPKAHHGVGSKAWDGRPAKPPGWQLPGRLQVEITGKPFFLSPARCP